MSAPAVAASPAELPPPDADAAAPVGYRPGRSPPAPSDTGPGAQPWAVSEIGCHSRQVASRDS